jgi:hypothetical protein
MIIAAKDRKKSGIESRGLKENTEKRYLWGMPTDVRVEFYPNRSGE